MRLTDAEWSVLEVLWGEKERSLKEMANALAPIQGWSKKTVFTYLTRMEAKGLVTIDRERKKPYSARVSRDTCARAEGKALCDKVYGGAAGDMITAFLKESTISRDEVRRLRQLLDDMEV